MSRKPFVKKLEGTRLASTYGGWMYCDHCGKNIGYLCFSLFLNRILITIPMKLNV